MKINWDNWLYYNADMFVRHIGSAGLASTATLFVNGKFSWQPFFTGLLAGAIIPTLFTILQKGLPKPDDDNEKTDPTTPGTPAP